MVWELLPFPLSLSVPRRSGLCLLTADAPGVGARVGPDAPYMSAGGARGSLFVRGALQGVSRSASARTSAGALRSSAIAMAATAPLLLFLLGALWVPPSRAGSHSLRYFDSALSEGLPGVPAFTEIGYVDDVEIAAYSSASRRMEPRAPWMGRISESDPQYWEENTANARGSEAVFKAGVRTVMGRHNQTAGLHVFQLAYGCELREDGGPGGGVSQWAYDGRDFVSLDEKHERYTAAMEAATITADRWNGEESIAQRDKAYLEQTCIEWLRRYLDYGKERLQRRVPPQAMISRRKTNGATTLTCYAYGFYPRDIEAKWERDGVEVNWKTQTILPNTDGTYQIRTTVELPEGHDEKDYRCLVDHTGLEEIIIKVYEEKFGTSIWIIVAAIVGVVTLVALVTAAVIWKRKRAGKSNTAGAQGNSVYIPVQTNGLPGQDSSSSTNSV